MRKIVIVFGVICFILSSCSSPKFFTEIKSTYKSKEDLVKEYGVESVSKSKFDPHKLILSKLSEKLKKTNHIIYYYSPENTWNSDKFYGAIFDVQNNKYIYFENKENRPRKLIITDTFEYPDDNYYKFVIEKFREGKIEYLKKLGNNNISGVRTIEIIYDINLTSEKTKKITFQNFLFMNGKPTSDFSDK